MSMVDRLRIFPSPTASRGGRVDGNRGGPGASDTVTGISGDIMSGVRELFQGVSPLDAEVHAFTDYVRFVQSYRTDAVGFWRETITRISKKDRIYRATSNRLQALAGVYVASEFSGNHPEVEVVSAILGRLERELFPIYVERDKEANHR